MYSILTFSPRGLLHVAMGRPLSSRATHFDLVTCIVQGMKLTKQAFPCKIPGRYGIHACALRTCVCVHVSKVCILIYFNCDNLILDNLFACLMLLAEKVHVLNPDGHIIYVVVFVC